MRPPVKLSIVIPALNEVRRLPPTVERVYAFLHESPQWVPAEVVVVDDGSSDGTADAAQTVAAPAGVGLVVARHEVNRGKGAAVRTGFAQTRGDSVLITDADLAAPISELPVLGAASGPKTVAIGSRAVDRSLIEHRQPLYRDLMGRTFNLITRCVALSGIHDTQCGFKLFPGELARSLARVQRLDGFAFDVELLVLARHWGYRIVETGVRWNHVEASRVLPVRHSSEMFRDVLRLGWWRATGALPDLPGTPS
jgi:dolichyl-phosphate beta-glucosyltransferase